MLKQFLSLGLGVSILAASLFSPCLGDTNFQPSSLVKSTYKVSGDEGTGTGWVVAQDKDVKYVVTCDHVVDGQRFSMKLYGKGVAPSPAEVVYEDKVHDIAVIKTTEHIDRPVLTVGNKVPDYGTPIEMMGMPLAHPFVLFKGSVGNPDIITMKDGTEVFTVDSPALPGDSGSAVVTEDGIVVGMLDCGWLYGGFVPTHLTGAIPCTIIREDLIKAKIIGE